MSEFSEVTDLLGGHASAPASAAPSHGALTGHCYLPASMMSQECSCRAAAHQQIGMACQRLPLKFIEATSVVVQDIGGGRACLL